MLIYGVAVWRQNGYGSIETDRLKMSRWRKIDRWPRFYTYIRRRTRETWLGSKLLFWIQPGWAHQKRLLHLQRADIFLRRQGCGHGFAPSTHVFDTTFWMFRLWSHPTLTPVFFLWPKCRKNWNQCFLCFCVEGATKRNHSLESLKDGKKWWNKNLWRWRALEVNTLKITTINWWSNFWALLQVLDLNTEHQFWGFVAIHSPMTFMEMETSKFGLH